MNLIKVQLAKTYEQYKIYVLQSTLITY